MASLSSRFLSTVERVGNRLRLLVSELAGRATVVLKGRDLGLDLENEGNAVGRVLDRVTR